MIATDSPCLTAAQLRDVAAGRLPADRFDQLMEHLEACSECQERAAAVDEFEDSVVAALASPAEADPHAAEPDCLAMLQANVPQHRSAVEGSAPPVQQLGPYRLIRPLGSGGMGAVFLARHTRLRRQCAIKLLPRDRGFDAAWRERFDREMAAVAALDDPHIVAATDAGEADGWHYLVMEFLDGLDLSRLSARMGPLAVADACELARQASVGLTHIHAVGLVHRDVKPSNLMLTRDGVVKILDLGLVLTGSDPLPADDRLTTVGQLMGTLAYMAPEQLNDSTRVDFRADLYALGATLYRLLTGRPPHGSVRGLAPLVVAKTTSGPPPVTEHRSDLPEPLADLVERLLQRDPDRRPNSATAVAEALGPHAAGARPKRLAATALRKPAADGEPPVSAASLSMPAAVDAAPPRRSRRRWIAAAAALPLLVLAGITIAILTDRGQLVIESEADGLDVSIQRGDELVEQLELSTGENEVTLRSGTYTVTLDAQGDGLKLSDDTATVTRGDQTVLRVRRDPAPTVTSVTPEDDETAPRYRGETLEHWLAVLENERDVETVIDAMQAAVALTKDEAADGEAPEPEESEQAKAAAAMLTAARRYGGMQSSGPNVQSSHLKSPSERFMGFLLPLYPAFLPNPGLQVISHELAVGTQESSMAAIYLLHSYLRDVWHDDVYRPEFGELQRWSDTDRGRKKLRELSVHLGEAVERLGGWGLRRSSQQEMTVSAWQEKAYRAQAVAMGYQVRLVIDELLNVNPFEDTATSARLRESIEEAAAYHKRLFEQDESPLGSLAPHLIKEEVEATRRNSANVTDAQTAAWAAVPSLLLSYYEYQSDAESPLAVLKYFGERTPVATADALLGLLASRGLSTRGAGGFADGGASPLQVVGGGEHRTGNVTLLEQAIEFIGKSTSKPQFAVETLSRAKEQLRNEGTAPQEILDALQSAIERLESRVESP